MGRTAAACAEPRCAASELTSAGGGGTESSIAGSAPDVGVVPPPTVRADVQSNPLAEVRSTADSQLQALGDVCIPEHNDPAAPRMVRAVRPWTEATGAAATDLHFNTDALIELISDEPGGGWVTGKIGSEEGIFPQNYAVELTNNGDSDDASITENCSRAETVLIVACVASSVIFFAWLIIRNHLCFVDGLFGDDLLFAFASGAFLLVSLWIACDCPAGWCFTRKRLGIHQRFGHEVQGQCVRWEMVTTMDSEGGTTTHYKCEVIFDAVSSHEAEPGALRKVKKVLEVHASERMYWPGCDALADRFDRTTSVPVKLSYLADEPMDVLPLSMVEGHSGGICGAIGGVVGCTIGLFIVFALLILNLRPCVANIVVLIVMLRGLHGVWSPYLDLRTRERGLSMLPTGRAERPLRETSTNELQLGRLWDV